MSTEDEERKAICILSFDSGGPGTYSQLLILNEYMSRLAHDLDVAEEDVYPMDYFDLMGGVGFGGLVSIMLGHLRMNVDEAIDALITVAIAVFSEGSPNATDPETNSMKLKEAIEEMLQTRGIPVTTKMYERGGVQTRCKVVLYAATSTNIRHPQAFRTYSFRGASLNPTIVEAVCATMAIPSYFVPVKIGRGQQTFVGGPLGANNPTRELLKEAGAVFGNERRVAQIINIGCGVPPVLSLEAMANESVAARLLKEMPDECETVARELTARLYDVDVYLRLSVGKGIGTIEMGQWNILGDIEMHTACYIESQPITQVLETSLIHLQQRSSIVTLGHLPGLAPRHVSVLAAEDFANHWDGGLWEDAAGIVILARLFVLHVAYVDASSLSSTEADLQAWSRALGDGHEHDAWEDAVRILAGAPEDGRWGLILDNADDPTLNLDPVLPKSVNLTVIITSRNRNLGNLSTTYHMELGEMKSEEALTTLLHAARRQLPLSAEELKSAQAILKELGCLAVALVQAGTYCHELSYSFTQYLTLFYSHRAELMKKAEPSSLDNYQRGAYTTLDLSYNALPQKSRDFLRLISFFHHTDIPLSALATAAKENFGDPHSYLPRTEDHASVITDLERLLCANGSWSELQVQETLRTLRSFSLLSITSIDDFVLLQLHPLIQAWWRDMDPSTAQHHRAMALQVLTACCRNDAFRLRPQLLPHILDIQDQLKGQDMHVNDLMATGQSLRAQGYYQAAEELFKTALQVVGKTPKNHEECISTISTHLASVYRDKGRWNEAEKLGLEALEQLRKVLGVMDQHTIWAAGTLAVTYAMQGRWSEAERLDLEVLAQRREVLGMEHPHTTLATANLASTLHAQGRWSEAEVLDVEVMEKHRRNLGMEHPDTVKAAAHLASTYCNQGRWAEAEKLELEVLQQRRRVLGLEHPDTILAAANLAVTYSAQDRYREAEKLQLEVLGQRRKILGLEHPSTILAAANLAATYRQQNRWEECTTLLAQAVQLSLKVLGQSHPHTQIIITSLLDAYERLGKEKEAQEMRALLLSQITDSQEVAGP